MKLKITSGIVTGVLGGASALALAFGYTDVAANLSTPGEPVVIVTALGVLLPIVAGFLPGIKKYVEVAPADPAVTPAPY